MGRVLKNTAVESQWQQWAMFKHTDHSNSPSPSILPALMLVTMIEKRGLGPNTVAEKQYPK